MLDTNYVNPIKIIPQSDTAVGRQIYEMAQDVRFAIKIDETIDICNDAQLIVYVYSGNGVSVYQRLEQLQCQAIRVALLHVSALLTLASLNNT
ncbi:hypothetical protein PR048_015983 [Dryococelus australis]|uniref:Uncharacterized protein n=1 Tax=Dryococelus australis TaxID=614101 RepID=A0ABQ9HIG4_9NEOP|nr:hypothetical protein PR048_015983 [Dryococelus australis]